MSGLSNQSLADRALVVSGASRAAGGKGVAVPATEVNGNCYIDSQVLVESGVTDLSRYGGGDDPILDIFVDKP